MADENRRRAFSRVYTFRDVACLQVLNALRNEAKVPLQHLREVKEKLSHLGEDIWANTTLYVLNKRVVFHNPETDRREDAVTSQGALQIPLAVVTRRLEDEMAKLRARDESQRGRITRKRNVAHNRPVIAGTRIPIKTIKAFAEDGYSVADILKEYPTLSEADVRAALNDKEAA
jgi:uncharacterized protein (DUF433 family)